MTRREFPAAGRDWDDLKAEMRARRVDDIDWRGGRAPLFVFLNDEKTAEIGKRAYNEFFAENALGRKRAFHSIDGMESEVLEFGLSLLSAPDNARGIFTSGGSESILVAVKAARDYWRAVGSACGPGSAMNLVMPISGHPAFDKACDLMGIAIRRAPLRPDKKVDVEAVRGLIDGETIAIVGSAPSFPHGVIDPIEALSKLAVEQDVWLHVDACVGGWITPFFAMNGRPVPSFDFRHAGVRSISADLHKFGFCPKPASTAFVRNEEDADRSAFVADAWPSGRFETSTLVGTRPGGAVASAWAVLNHLGVNGFREAASRMAAIVDSYVEGIEQIPGLRMVAVPDLTILNATSDEVDMFAVADRMRARGWLPGLTKDPQGIHLMLSAFHAPARDKWLQDVAAAMKEVRGSASVVAQSTAIY